jgi:hypothetical protein
VSLRWTWRLIRHRDEFQFEGRCLCGNPSCQSWVVSWRGERVGMRERTYDRLRHLVNG